jgi:Na+:H+ antiporter, NhaA family
VSQKNQENRPENGIFVAPWETRFDKFLSPFEEFLHRQTTGGLLLMVTAVIAMVLANGPLADTYFALLKTYTGVFFGDWSLKMSLHHWINDALMAIFFFVVGLELKREFLVGELANPRNAVLPIVAAIGGMVVPALFYFALNPTGPAAAGWGIPMATDIAFAIGALALLGDRIPKALVTFLVALAIVDDLGAVMVIAFFYTETIAIGPLAGAAGCVAILIVFNRSGVRNAIPYFMVAVVLWYTMLLSGVHATLAGVIGAMTVPAIPRYDPARFNTHVRALMDRFEENHKPGKSIMTNIGLRTQVQALENSVLSVETPLQRLEHIWHLPVAFIIIPTFALANAGIPIDLGSVSQTLNHPVFLGISLGLTLGKFIGIVGACWIALRLGVAVLPKDTRFTHIAGASLLAGIGFTMSIFVAQLAFNGQDDLLLIAKTGILAASLFAGSAGMLWLYLTTKPTAL